MEPARAGSMDPRRQSQAPARGCRGHATPATLRVAMRAGESVVGAASRCPPCADGDFTASSKQAHFPTAVASDHLRSSSYGASANLARSRHSGATAERRPYLLAELLCDMEMQKVRQIHLPMPPGVNLILKGSFGALTRRLNTERICPTNDYFGQQCFILRCILADESGRARVKHC
jgi:hypothetical protein